MEVELLIGFTLSFCLALVFLILARGTEKIVDKSFFYTASGVLFFITAPLFAVFTQDYAFIGLVFLVPAIFSFGFAGQSFFQLYKKSSMEDWEKNEGEEEGEP